MKSNRNTCLEKSKIFGSPGPARQAGSSKRMKETESRTQENVTGPIEYTLYLEEDCPGKVTYYVFVDRSRAQSAQWMEWRKLFHKSKAEPQYGSTSALLEQAAQAGFPIDGELRFIEIGGDLVSKKPEDFLTGDLKISPIYDLKGRAVSMAQDNVRQVEFLP